MNKNQLQEFLNALSDPIRFKLLTKIFDAFLLYNPNDEPAYRGNCVTNLRKSTSLTQPTISHHLKILEEARIVTTERQGKWIHYLPNIEYIERFKEELGTFFSFGQPKQKHIEAITLVADEKKLQALVDLLSNHEIKLKHFTKRKTTYSIYLLDKQSGDMFLFLYNKTTNLLSIRAIGEPNMVSGSQLVSLTKKYIPTLG